MPLINSFSYRVVSFCRCGLQLTCNSSICWNLADSRRIRDCLVRDARGKQTLIMELIWGGWLTAITKIDFTPVPFEPSRHPCRCAPEAPLVWGSYLNALTFHGTLRKPGDTPLFYWHGLPTIILLRTRPYSLPGTFSMLLHRFQISVSHYNSYIST